MIQKETWEKYVAVEMENRGDILREGFESESVRVALKSFETFFRAIGIQGNNLNVILENIAAHLVLFERLTRREEADKRNADIQINKMMEKTNNINNFKYSLQLMADQYMLQNKISLEEKKIINRIIKKVKLDKVESKNENVKK